MSGPTFGPQFDIDLAAQRCLAELLEPNWLLRKRVPDVFIDYEIEQRTSGEPTGRTAYVQLKGQAALFHDEHCAKVVMETKHLSYYANSVRVPVFVVVIDVSRKHAFYLFIQPWLGVHAERLSGQTTLTVLVPLANELQNHPKFLADFERACAEMLDRYPGRPEAAVASIEKHYESLDDRFRVRVTSSSTARHIQVTARAPASVSLNVGGIPSDKLPEVVRAIDWGKAFRVADVELSAQGSKLFETLWNSSRGVVQWKPVFEVPCTFRFSAKNRGKVSTLTLPAKLTAGSKGTSIETDAVQCPLHAEMMIFWTKPGEKLQAQLQMQMRPDAWVGLDLMSAPHRLAVTSFMRSIGSDAAVTVEMTTDSGNFEAQIKPARSRFSALKSHCWWFRLIADAARVAEHYGLRPKIPAPEKVSAHDVSELSFAYDSLRSKIVRRPWVTLNQKELSEISTRIKDAIESDGSVHCWLKAAFPCIIEVFGVERTVGIVEIEPTYCRLSASTAPLDTYAFSFQVEQRPRRHLALRIREEGKDQPTTGLNAGAFVIMAAPNGRSDG